MERVNTLQAAMVVDGQSVVEHLICKKAYHDGNFLKKISFVIPVFRNEKSITITCRNVLSQMEQEFQDQIDFEIILMDDGSDDNSLTEMLQLRNEEPKIRIISFSRNFGQVSAILAGLEEATGDAVINLTADLQDPIDLIPKMISSWLAGSEVVICHRTDREDELVSKLFSNSAWMLIKSAIPEMPVGGFDIFLLDRKALDSFISNKARNRFMQGEILGLGYRSQLIPYVRMRREYGKSQWSFDRKLKYFIDAIVDSSYAPIRLMSLFGIITAFGGFSYALVIVFLWFQHKTPSVGWAPIMIVSLILGGMTMFMLGVIGEYVWRILDEVKGRPRYIVRERHF